MDDVRVCTIGYGNMGTGNTDQLAEKVPGAVVSAVCDNDPKRLAAARERFGDAVQYFDSPDAFFASDAADAVYIATPHYDHPPLAIKALEKNMHVLVEKPAGVYTRQVREMNEAAENSDRVFGIMLNQRTRPLHQKCRDLVQAGEIGEVRRTNWIITTWFRSQAYYNSGGWRATWSGEGGGVLLNQCPHNLDLWQWLAGMPTRIHAFCQFGKYHDIEVEDVVNAYAEYENGATGMFVTTTGEAPGTNRFEVIGDRGKLIMEAGKLTFWRTRQSVQEYSDTTDKRFASPESWECAIPVGGKDGGHLDILRNWIAAIREGKELLAPGYDGMNSLQLSNAMLLSAWTGKTVDIPVDEEAFYEQLQERIKTSSFVKETTGDSASGDDFASSFA